MRMKVLLIILGVILLLAGAGLDVLSHPAFGLWRHVAKERIQASPNYRDGKKNGVNRAPVAKKILVLAGKSAPKIIRDDNLNELV